MKYQLKSKRKAQILTKIHININQATDNKLPFDILINNINNEKISEIKVFYRKV